MNLTTNLNYVEISINPFYNEIPNFIEEDVSSYNNYPKRKIYLNKTTEFNLNLNETINAIRISFLYIPGFEILYTNIDKSSEVENSLKQNVSIAQNISLSYRNRRTYIFDISNLEKNIFRFYFIPQSYQSRRFLQVTSQNNETIETEFKYEISNSISQFPIYSLNSNNLSINESEQKYIVSIEPLKLTTFNQNISLIDSVIYKLKVFNQEKVNEFEINSPNKPNEDKLYHPSNINLNIIQFEIDRKTITSGYYYLDVSATTFDKQIIDYNLLSYKLIHFSKEKEEEEEIEESNNNNIDKVEEKKKKSKWWIALIVIGILLIIAAVVILLRKYYFSRNKNEEKNDEQTKDGTTNNLPNINTPTPKPDPRRKDDNSSFSHEDLDEENI